MKDESAKTTEKLAMLLCEREAALIIMKHGPPGEREQAKERLKRIETAMMNLKAY